MTRVNLISDKEYKQHQQIQIENNNVNGINTDPNVKFINYQQLDGVVLCQVKVGNKTYTLFQYPDIFDHDMDNTLKTSYISTFLMGYYPDSTILKSWGTIHVKHNDGTHLKYRPVWEREFNDKS